MVELMLVAVLLLQVAILVAFLARRGSGRTTAQAAEPQPAGTSLEPASTEVPDEVGHEEHDRERTVAALLAGEELAIRPDGARSHRLAPSTSTTRIGEGLYANLWSLRAT